MVCGAPLLKDSQFQQSKGYSAISAGQFVSLIQPARMADVVVKIFDSLLDQ
jgi:hypothetical protein